MGDMCPAVAIGSGMAISNPSGNQCRFPWHHPVTNFRSLPFCKRPDDLSHELTFCGLFNLLTHGMKMDPGFLPFIDQHGLMPEDPRQPIEGIDNNGLNRSCPYHFAECIQGWTLQDSARDAFLDK